MVPSSVNGGTTQGTEAVIYQQSGSSRVSVSAWVMGFNTVRQDTFMLRSLNRAGLRHVWNRQGWSLFLIHTTQGPSYTVTLARSPALALEVLIFIGYHSRNADMHSLYTSANGAASEYVHFNRGFLKTKKALNSME